MKQDYEISKRLHHAQADLAYVLTVFGDTLAKREKYKSGLRGLEAVRFFLMQTHHWLPRDVNALSDADLQFAMSEELAGWTLPKEAR